MSSLTSIAQNLGRLANANSPKILTAVGVAGVLSTSVLTAKGTVEAVRKYDEDKLQNEVPAEGKELFLLVWKSYIPAAGVAAATISCIIAGTAISTKRNAALLSIYTLTENGFREYQEKVHTTIGAKQEQAIRDEISQDKVNRNPVIDREVMILGAEGVLMYDELSGRYFKQDIEIVRRSVNDINQKVINEMYASQNDFYRLIGLPVLVYGEEIGWSTQNMLEVDFSTTMSEDNRPCVVLNYRATPIRGYADSFLH